MTTATLQETSMETEKKQFGGYHPRKQESVEMQREIAKRLLAAIEQKLSKINLPESTFFKMLGVSPTIACALRNGNLCRVESLAAIFLALGINMNEFFGALMPGSINFLTVYEKQMEEITRHEELAKRKRLELQQLLKSGRRPAVKG